MKKVDYLIVGFGIAGACFAKKCIDNRKTFHVVSDFKESASFVAAGMFNPIVLKRFVPVDDAIAQMEELTKTFIEFENSLDSKIIHRYPVYRIFANENEVKTWQKKIIENEILQKYLNPNIITDTFDNIHAPFGFGEVRNSGWIDIVGIIKGMRNAFSENFTSETFDFTHLDIQNKQYKEIQADKIIFSEGVKSLQNPFFTDIPIIKNKGETLIIETNETLPKVIFKSKNFLMPLGNNRYYVGATYDRTWSSDGISESNKEKLIHNLQHYFKGSFEIVEHKASFRPTTKDRKAIIGAHPQHQDMFIMNGMGTRGTFNAPSMAKYLFNHIENGNPIPNEYSVSRFYE